MSNKNYFKNISAKVSFMAKYFRVFRLLVIIVYLFYLEILVVNVFSAIEYIPSVDEVKRRFSPIVAKNEVINSIERYFSEKENNLVKNLQEEDRNNPFLPYKTENLNFIDSVSAPENNIPESNAIN